MRAELAIPFVPASASMMRLLLERLPTDLHVHALSFLEVHQLARLCRVTRSWRCLVRTAVLRVPTFTHRQWQLPATQFLLDAAGDLRLQRLTLAKSNPYLHPKEGLTVEDTYTLATHSGRSSSSAAC